MANKLKWNHPWPVPLSPQEETIKEAIHIICTEYGGNTTKFFEQLRDEKLSQDVESRTS